MFLMFVGLRENVVRFSRNVLYHFQMLFLATFFPTWEGAAGVYDFVGEFMKATVDLADLLGLHLVMSRNAGKGEYKIMVAAMGWATAELIMSRYSDHHERYAFNHYHGSNQLFVHVFLLGSWTALLVKAVLTGAISLCSLFLFVTLVHSN
ncbi:hypothetical protein cypCar_00041317 [Cyprinus carpio]|nr:hypothetical protein cypCar_00041317 [Cyprinus carpio]